jgi:hypothetical protein
MRQTSIAIISVVVVATLACGKSQAPPPSNQGNQGNQGDQGDQGDQGNHVGAQGGSAAQLAAEPRPSAQRIPFAGFDPKGEPEIQVAADGSIRVMFNFMPPSWVPDEQRGSLGTFKDFDQRLAKALGVPVSWEDRELFVIKAPRADTIERLKTFLAQQGKAR